MQSVDSRQVKISVNVKRSQWPGIYESRNVNDLHEVRVIRVVYVLYDDMVVRRNNG